MEIDNHSNSVGRELLVHIQKDESLSEKMMEMKLEDDEDEDEEPIDNSQI